MPIRITTVDRNLLAQLIARYGRDLVVEQAKKIAPGKVGAPPKTSEAKRETDWDNLFLAVFVADLAELFRTKGSKRPIEDALRAVFKSDIEPETWTDELPNLTPDEERRFQSKVSNYRKQRGAGELLKAQPAALRELGK